jgi:hypothetical protein
MGDEVPKRTRQAFEAGVREIALKLDRSIEDAKADDNVLRGVPAIVAAFPRRADPQVAAYSLRKTSPHRLAVGAGVGVVGSGVGMNSIGAVGVGVSEGLGEGLAVGVGRAVSVGRGVSVSVGVSVGVGAKVGVSEGVSVAGSSVIGVAVAGAVGAAVGAGWAAKGEQATSSRIMTR